MIWTYVQVTLPILITFLLSFSSWEIYWLIEHFTMSSMLHDLPCREDHWPVPSCIWEKLLEDFQLALIRLSRYYTPLNNDIGSKESITILAKKQQNFLDNIIKYYHIETKHLLVHRIPSTLTVQACKWQLKKMPEKFSAPKLRHIVSRVR